MSRSTAVAPVADREAAQPRIAALHLGDPYADIELGYVDWGPADAEHVVLCVQSYPRNGTQQHTTFTLKLAN